MIKCVQVVIFSCQSKSVSLEVLDLLCVFTLLNLDLYYIDLNL